MRRARTLLRQPPIRRRLVVEALVGMLRAWVLIRSRPFAAYAGRLGAAVPGEVMPEDAADPRLLKDVRWAILAVNRSFGGRFTCLMQAMACKSMLNRRGVANALVLGARISDRSGAARESMAAHAWVNTAGFALVGGEGRPGFIAVTSYLSGAEDRNAASSSSRSAVSTPE